MIIPQYTQYKINTGGLLEKDEIETIARVLNDSDNPAFIIYTFGKLSKRQLNTVKIFPLINETMVAAACRKGRFQQSLGIMTEYDVNYDNFVCEAIQLSKLPILANECAK